MELQRNNQQDISFYALISGILLNVILVFLYVLYSYKPYMPLLWLSSLFCVGFYFYERKSKTAKTHKLRRGDLFTLLILMALFIPLYFVNLYNVPLQVSPDESIILSHQQSLSLNLNEDLLGTSHYNGFPGFVFIVTGWLGRLMGGVNLYNERFINALAGIVVIVFSYLFFRTYKTKAISFAMTLLVGGSHVLITISRMDMRNNMALMFEVISFFFLMRSAQKKDVFNAFVGGTFAALSLYFYSPGAMIIIVWLVFLIILFISNIFPKKNLLKIFVASIAGFIITFSPLLTSYIAHPNGDFNKRQLLIFEQGRELEEQWVGASDIPSAVAKNFINGFTMFTNSIPDQANIYNNTGHGFFDPVSGILIWLSLLVLFVKFLIKEKIQLIDILIVSGFFTIWLFLCLVVNKTPDYTRMLIILPFTAFIIISGVEYILKFFAFFFKNVTDFKIPSSIIKLCCMTLSACILLVNLNIFNDYSVKADAFPLDFNTKFGLIARQIEKYSSDSDYKFVIATDQNHPAGNWGEVDMWQDLYSYFALKSRTQVEVRSLDAIIADSHVYQKAVIFLDAEMWTENEQNLSRIYPFAKIMSLDSNGYILALYISN